MIKILICGDFASKGRIADAIQKGDYSFFDGVRDCTRESDYSIVNLESPIVDRTAEPIDKTGPCLKGNKQVADALQYAGFNGVTLANNHFRDYGQVGVEDTINCLAGKIDCVGGGKTLAEARAILYKQIEGKIVAIINFCENEWSIAKKDRGGSNPMNVITNFNDIRTAREKTDMVIVIVHGGVEHYPLPTPRMKELYQFYIDAGADVVINHHQHCFSGWEQYHEKWIFYGLGNFCFDALPTKKPSEDWSKGYAVMLNYDGFHVEPVILPYKQCTMAKTGVEFLNFEEIKKELNQLNQTIANDESLINAFNKLCQGNLGRFSSILLPFRNRVLKKLSLSGIIPKPHLNEKMKNLRAYISCESHRECLLNFLDNELKQ